MLGKEPVSARTRERLIRCGTDLVQVGGGPATLAIDFSFFGTVLTYAAAMHVLHANTEAVKLARIALGRMDAIGKEVERGQRLTGLSRVAQQQNRRVHF